MKIVIVETVVTHHTFETENYGEDHQGKTREEYVDQLKEACDMVGLDMFSTDDQQHKAEHFLEIDGELLT